MSEAPKDRWSKFSGGGDSLDTVQRVMELEEAFDITIPDEDAVKIRSVAEAMQYIAERKRGNP